MRYPENAIFFFQLAFRIAISSLHPPYLTDTRVNQHVRFREFIRSATGYSFFQVGQRVKAKPDPCSLLASVSVLCPVSILVLHSSSLRTLQWTIFGFTSQWNSYNHFVYCLVCELFCKFIYLGKRAWMLVYQGRAGTKPPPKQLALVRFYIQSGKVLVLQISRTGRNGPVTEFYRTARLHQS